MRKVSYDVFRPYALEAAHMWNSSQERNYEVEKRTYAPGSVEREAADLIHEEIYIKPNEVEAWCRRLYEAAYPEES